MANKPLTGKLVSNFQGLALLEIAWEKLSCLAGTEFLEKTPFK